MIVTRPGPMARVTDACADDAEVLALSTLRMIAAGYSTGDVACWDMAYAGAERLLRPEIAGRLVASVTTLVRAVRAERPQAWSFMPVTCCRVTGDEATIVRLMTVSRGGDPLAITAAASDVTGRDASSCLETAARIVAQVLEEAAGALVEQEPAKCRRPAALH